MASVDITSVIIQAKSDGIDAATNSLNKLADASDRAEASTANLGTTSKKTNSAYAEGVAAADKLLTTYQKQVDLLGANASQQMAYNVALKGGNDAQILIAQQLGAQQDAYKRLASDQAEAIRMNKAFNASLEETGKAAGHAASGASGITRELIVLGHEASQGQFSRFGGSMIVLAERFDAGGKLVRWFTAGVEAAGGSVMAFVAPVAAAVAVVGTLATAFMTWLHSVQAIHEFNQELILTGGYAGKSANELYTMADSIGKVYGNVGTAREAMTKLVATGKFSADQINDITKAAVGLYTYGGVAIDKTIAQFEKLAKEPLTNTERSYSQVSKAVMELDQSMHFLEPSVMKAIIDQEKLGNLHEASAIATKALADEETKRAKELEENMTMLGKLAHTVGAAFTNMWNSLWTKESPQQKLAEVVAQLKALPSAAEASKGIYGNASNIEQRKALLKEAANYQVQILAEEKTAIEKAAKDEANTEANLAGIYFRNLEDKSKGEDRFTQAKLAYDRQIEASTGTVFERSKEQQEKDIALLHKLYDEKHKVKALGFADINLEISSIKSAMQAQLDAADLELKSTKALADARKINVFQQQKETDDALQLKLTALKEGEKAELTAIANDIARKGRSATEIKELQNRYVQAYTTSEKAINGVNEALQKNDNLVSELAGKAADAQAQANAKVIDSIKASVNAVQAKIDAYNRLPESVKKAGVTEKQIQDQITQSYIDNLQAELDQTVANNNVEEPIAKARIEFLKQEIQLKEQLKSKQLEEEAIQATNKAIQDYNTAWKQANKQIGDDLAAAIIDGGGKGWKKLIKDMEMAFAKMILRPILEPISSSLASLTTQVGASSPSGSSIGGAVGAAQMASTMYKAFSEGVNNVVGSAFTSFGNMIGSQTISGFGAGISGGTSTAAAQSAYAASGNTAVASSMNIGSTVSAYLPMIAATVASYFGAKAIAGDYKISGIGNALNFLGLAGGVVNRAFGMGSKNVTQQGISGTVSDEGTTGMSYQDWVQKGGWFRSDKSGKETQALSADILNTFTSGLTSMKATSSDFAKSMNVSSDSLKNYSKSFDIQFVGLQEVKGTAAEQAAIIQSNSKIQQDAITKFFTTMGDDMATKLVPNIAEFAKQGETASVTLQRLSDTFKTTNAVMDLFGINSEKVFGGLGLESAKARQYIVDLAGGISNLGSQSTFYAQNFLNAKEQIAPVQKAVTNALAELGHSEVTTVEGFKALVNSLNLVDPAQAQLFESLMQLAPAFKQVTDAADAATKAAQDQAAADKAKADQAKQDMIAGLKSAAQNDFDILTKAINTAKNDAQVTYDTQAAILNAQISSLTTVQQNIDSLSSALDSALHTMTDNTVMAMTRAQAQAALDDVLNTARTTGQLPTADSMKNILSTLSKDPAANYSSYADYIKDVGITAGKVSNLEDITKGQKTIVEKQLATAKEQLSMAKDTLDATVNGLSALQNIAQEQLDAMNGTTILIQNLVVAMTNFAKSVSVGTQAQAGNIGSNGLPINAATTPAAMTKGVVTSIYEHLLNRAPDTQGLANASDWLNHGGTALDLATNIMNSPEYKALHGVDGSHAGGLDNVPFDGYTAKLHKGEMVLPAKQAKGVAQGEDMKAVVAAINKSNNDNVAVTAAMQGDIRWLKKLFQQMAPSGDRLQMHDIGAA